MEAADVTKILYPKIQKMKKLCLVIVGLCLGIVGAFSQSTDSAYKNRKLKLEEVNLVSSYYSQDGNNSAVEGGVGTEKLDDIATVIDIKLTKLGKHNLKHSITAEIGLDHYTSASSDRIDMKANSSASSVDNRIYPSLSWNVENEKTGNSVGVNVSFSTEYDYTSFGFGAAITRKSKDKNRELSIKAQAYLDKVTLIFPVELRTNGDHYGTASRNSFSASFSLSQVINKRLQLAFLLDVVKQDGYLGLPFHRVYFPYDLTGIPVVEKLPSKRFKIPVGLRANYFWGDKIVLRSFYRFYHDDWGLNAHTIDMEASYKFTPFFSFVPFYRFYNQAAVDYFAPKYGNNFSDEYYTSNYDLSGFSSNFFGAGFRFAPPKGILKIKHWNMFELRYGHYHRSTGMNADIVSLNMRFK